MSGFRSRFGIGLAATALAFACAAGAAAQPQVPSTVYGSVAVDGKPVPDGTEIRGFVDGVDCTQLGPTYRGTINEGGVSAYLINIVHESQKPGCGKPGKTVTFTIGGRAAVQTTTWFQGPRQVSLSAGQGEPPALPTATPTRPLPPAAATTTEAASTGAEQSTPTPGSGGKGGFDTRVPTGTPTGAPAVASAPAPGGQDGSFPVVYVFLIVLGAIVFAGTAAGIALGRRNAPRSGGPGER